MKYSDLKPSDVYSELFTYDPDTGIVKHNPNRPPETFCSSRGYSIWKAKHSGNPLSCRNRQGYIKCGLHWFGKDTGHFAHRIALIIPGADLEGLYCDHLNGIRDDNRLVNLTAATRLENQRNQGKSRLNTSGVAGVYKIDSGWQAKIKVKGKSVHLGCWETIEEAAAARKACEKLLGFNNQHGIRESHRG